MILSNLSSLANWMKFFYILKNMYMFVYRKSSVKEMHRNPAITSNSRYILNVKHREYAFEFFVFNEDSIPCMGELMIVMLNL